MKSHRRSLLKGAAASGGAVVAGLAGLPRAGQAAQPGGPTAGSARAFADPVQRAAAGRALRIEAAARDYPHRFPAHPDNGDEQAHPYLATYTKGLPHNELGEVQHQAHDALLHALATGEPAQFAAVPAGAANARKQLGPQGAFSFELMGADTHGLVVPPAPGVAGAETAAELAELYWLALLRDLPFTEYEGSSLAAEAAGDLSRYAGFRGPRSGGRVTPGTLFRSGLPGAEAGPFISQFLLKPVQFGISRIPQLHDTVAPGVDYLGSFAEWLAVQNGANVATVRDFAHQRYVFNGRDMAHYTHFDVLYQAYLFAALILLGSTDYPASLQDAGNPYFRSANQMGFNSFGTPHLTSLLADVAIRAIKHTEFQQFKVHRRIRPEELCGRVDVHLRQGRYPGLVHDDLLTSPVLQRSRAKYGSYLLTQSFPEGSPMSPAYQSGHSTVAGACVTVLKAWFNESYVLSDPVVPGPDGTSLVPYEGADRDRLTVGGELNKLAGNIGAGRSSAGVHYRSDNAAAFTFGEQIAIDLMREQRALYLEKSAITVTRFDGTTVTI
ncbi:phosphoesterase [Actinoplanes sp. L3-i22]|uniref:phosphoesterase n=1 Tax=Actinoplanes sp. L3-i22 TaxID=2836373 RepID=UPI001C76D753|nr:phosphoesterase [Actinoplanes sp. L3-i22]BCY08842.1 phosphoesterase [Actinoplanes sp. L3-i22]